MDSYRSKLWCTGQFGVADWVVRHRACPLREGPYVRRWYQVFLAVHDEHGGHVAARREAAVVAVAADQARDAGLAVAPARIARFARAELPATNSMPGSAPKPAA